MIVRIVQSVLLTAFLSTSLLLTACNKQDLSEPLTREYDDYIGEFKSLGSLEVVPEITHLFETEDGGVLYAYSARYDLDDAGYFGKKVSAYGVVTTYENLDKALFEVKRITEAPAEDEVVEITSITVDNGELGVSFNYPSDWTLENEQVAIRLVALSTQDAQDEILIAKLDAGLSKTSEDSQEDRATELREYVGAHYSEWSEVQGEMSYVGPDRLFSVHYKNEDGDATYFIPRETQLFELSYTHQSDFDQDRLDNGNIFSSLVSEFQFIPYGEEITEESEEESQNEPEVLVEEDLGEESVSEEQVSFTEMSELESTSFAFKMSYPEPWYYWGDSSGFYFDDAPLEGSEGAILHMLFNTTTTEGTSRSGDTVSITVKEGDRYYTLTGPDEYENVMRSMANSITPTKE